MHSYLMDLQFYIKEKHKIAHLQNKQDVFVKYYAPNANKVWKCYFKHKVHSLGHEIIDFCVIWKDIISGEWIPNMKSLSLMVLKL